MALYIKFITITLQSESVSLNSKKNSQVNYTYSCKSWTLKDRLKTKLNSIEMRDLRRIQGKTRKYKIRNEIYKKKVEYHTNRRNDATGTS